MSKFLKIFNPRRISSTTIRQMLLMLTVFLVLVFNSFAPGGVILSATEKVDGTTGPPLGGVGAGALKFCPNSGNFALAAYSPCQRNNFATLSNTCFQFYSNRGGTISTNVKLTSVQTGGRSDDDAFFPVQYANFGTINNVTVNLTAFSPLHFSNFDLMSYPYAFFELKLTNNQSSSVDVACAFQIGTSVTPSGVTGKGIKTSGGIEYAVYGKSNDTSAIVTYGNDNGFFTSGQCNNSLSGTINKTAVKVTLAGSETKYLKFVFVWYNGTDSGTYYTDRYYYANTYTNAGSFADLGFTNFDTFKNNAVTLVTKMRASNLPEWLKNQTMNSLCNLSNNWVYTKDGRMACNEGQWEHLGTMDQMWHSRPIFIMVAPSMIWQELEYWARTQKTNPEGQIHHDFDIAGVKQWTLVGWDDQQHADYRTIDQWVDLNCGLIISVYEAFIATDNHTELDYFWPYVKKAGQRILNLVAQYGNSTYPYTFDGTSSSYDAGGDSDPYNSSISIVTYQIMSDLCGIKGETSLKSTYDNAFTTAKNSFQARWLNSSSNNFPYGRISESVLTGQQLGSYLKFDQFWPNSNLDYGIARLNEYYNPINGLGYPAGTYDEWPEYMMQHYAGLLLQTGRYAEWRAMQFDYYERCFLDRDRVFAVNLRIPSKVTTPDYLADSFDGSQQYISYPDLWRNYFEIIGYHRNKHTGELWVEPRIPEEMNHVLTDGMFISPEGYGSVSCTESGTRYQNQNITVKSDNNISITKLYVRDRYGTNVTAVKVNGVTQSYSRIGTGYAKRIQINWSGTIGPGGTTIEVTGDAPAATATPTPTPAGTSTPTPGPTQPPRSAFNQIEAESYDSMSGVQIETCSDSGGGQDLGYIHNGDYVVYNNIDFGAGANNIDLRVASNNTNGGNIEVLLDSLTGQSMGICAITYTGGWQTWVTKSFPMGDPSGVHNLYFKFTGAGTGGLFNINWFKFLNGSAVTPTPTPTATITPTPTPTPVTTATPTPTPTPTTPPVTGNDEFNSATLNSQWSWVREDNTHWSLTAVSGFMRITTQYGDIYTTYADAKNILLQNATGDWTITSKLTFKPSQNYQQAGLIVYQDDNNYVKIVRSYSTGNKFQFAKEVGGTFSDTKATDGITGNISYLKLVKSGNNYSGYYSADGTTYTQVGTTQTVGLSTTRIGLIAINSYQMVPELNADFDYFHKN